MAGQASAHLCNTGFNSWTDGETFADYTKEPFSLFYASIFATDRTMTCKRFLDLGFCDQNGLTATFLKDFPDARIQDFKSGGWHAGSCLQCGCVGFSMMISYPVPPLPALPAVPAPAVVTPAPWTPCPSSDCWTYDEDTQTCSMVGTCATLECGATDMDITFSPELYNLEGKSATFAGGLAPTSDGDSDWVLAAPLGTAGMTYIIDSDTNEIVFSLKVAVLGDDMRTRTDDVEDNIISLGSQSVVTTPFGAGVTFSCSYPLAVDVESQAYTVQGASVVDTFFGTGSLSAGFAMSLNNGEGTAFMLGNNLAVAISWSVTAVQELTFYIDQCTVEHGTTIIPIVKGGCFAKTLNVVEDANLQGFNYPIFKGVGETAPEQTIKCTVNVCKMGECDNPPYTADCPGAHQDATGDDRHYNFEVIGSGP